VFGLISIDLRIIRLDKKGERTMKYRCLNCKYKFEPKTGRIPARCPFCSSLSIKRDETAADLLSEAGRRQIPE